MHGAQRFAGVRICYHEQSFAPDNIFRKEPLSSIIRDFKKFTATRIIEAISNINESRREWLLNKFAYAGSRNSNNTTYQLWIQDYNAETVAKWVIILALEIFDKAGKFFYRIIMGEQNISGELSFIGLSC